MRVEDMMVSEEVEDTMASERVEDSQKRLLVRM